ncbi:MAG TPA: hypothetical protein VK797_02735 [Tepidisphaeraceae bacterium]|jgi:hypothetical protein|nr:hypothetical protein [Tepidisphaeraceae bacterium]
MKSLVMKSIYAGLGLIGSGTETVEQLGRKLARQVNVSEKDGERIARQLRSRSEKAIHALNKSLEKEVTRIVDGLHAAASGSAGTKRKKRSGKRKKARATH